MHSVKFEVMIYWRLNTFVLCNRKIMYQYCSLIQYRPSRTLPYYFHIILTKFWSVVCNHFVIDSDLNKCLSMIHNESRRMKNQTEVSHHNHGWIDQFFTRYKLLFADFNKRLKLHMFMECQRKPRNSTFKCSNTCIVWNLKLWYIDVWILLYFATEK
jgi:hypothetical protein